MARPPANAGRGHRAQTGAAACQLITGGALPICPGTIRSGSNDHRVTSRPSAIMANSPAALPATLDDYRVLRFNEWCALAGISLRTGRRLLAAGSGPAVVQLSSRRVGVSIAAHRQWLQRRERAPDAHLPNRACNETPALS